MIVVARSDPGPRCRLITTIDKEPADVPLERLFRPACADRRTAFRTQHGLIDQSLHSRMGVETTNGDGFGVGWYRDGNGGSPARYRSVTPAWSDVNLRDLAAAVESPLFLAHIRATTGTPV